MQIYAAFGDLPLAKLAGLGTGVYALVSDYRSTCPLCGGARCAVRHGIYLRRVWDLHGTEIQHIPIPRFRCRRRGPQPCGDTTFSVLPHRIVPRHRFSLPLMLRIVEQLRRRRTVAATLDALAEDHRCGAVVLEELQVYRVLQLFARAYRCMTSTAAGGALMGGAPPGGDGPLPPSIAGTRALGLAYAWLLPPPGVDPGRDRGPMRLSWHSETPDHAPTWGVSAASARPPPHAMIGGGPFPPGKVRFRR